MRSSREYHQRSSPITQSSNQTSRPYSCVQVAWHNQGWNSPDRSPQQNFDFISAIESWGYFQFRKQKNRIFIENWRHCLSFRQVLFEKSVPRTSCTRTYELANFFAAIVWGSNLNQILILLVQSEARVISSSENSKNLIFIETDVTVSVFVRCFLKNPSHGQVVRVRTNSPICLQRLCP